LGTKAVEDALARSGRRHQFHGQYIQPASGLLTMDRALGRSEFVRNFQACRGVFAGTVAMPQSSRISRSVWRSRHQLGEAASPWARPSSSIRRGGAGSARCSLSGRPWWGPRRPGQPGSMPDRGGTADDQVISPSRSHRRLLSCRFNALSARVGCESMFFEAALLLEAGPDADGAQRLFGALASVAVDSRPRRSSKLRLVDGRALRLLVARLEHAVQAAGSGVCPGFG